MKNATNPNQLDLLDFQIQVVKIPQPDGSLLIKPGRTLMVQPELTISQFSKKTGISIRHVSRLCDEGHLQHRRLTPKNKSKILIPISELARYKTLEGDV